MASLGHCRLLCLPNLVSISLSPFALTSFSTPVFNCVVLMLHLSSLGGNWYLHRWLYTWKASIDARLRARRSHDLATRKYCRRMCPAIFRLLTDLVRRRRRERFDLQRATDFSRRQLLRSWEECRQARRREREEQATSTVSFGPRKKESMALERQERIVAGRAIAAWSFSSKHGVWQRRQNKKAESFFLKRWVHHWIQVSCFDIRKRKLREESMAFPTKWRRIAGFNMLRRRCR